MLSRHRRRYQSQQLVSKNFVSKIKIELRKNNIPVPKILTSLTSLGSLLFAGCDDTVKWCWGLSLSLSLSVWWWRRCESVNALNST